VKRITFKLLRSIRNLALLALGPFDYFARRLNDKQDLPPLHLRRYVGPLRSFETSGAEFMRHLRQLADLRPDERVLDLGCGCGQIALQLKDYLDQNGSLVGVDIHRPSINWCRKKIGTRHSNFQFARIDVRNQVYNPHGAEPADTYQFPFADRSFDVILVKSVFTHMRPCEVGNYLREVARMMKMTGRCLATFFLLNEEQERLARKGANTLAFKYGEGVWRYVYEQSPESAVAYDESFVMQLLEKHGLRLKELFYGHWSGRKDGLSYQDILLIEKADSGSP
jgi:ubiquinone/menaquinone biosynthesis C-methylase UbiE